MSLSTLALVVFLVLFAIQAFGWVSVALWVMGLFALIAAIAYVAESFSGRTFTVWHK